MAPRDVWQLAKQTVAAFLEDGALSKGAAIAFYAVTALGPILLIVAAIVGFLYGRAAARGALLGKLRGFMGPETASFLQSAIQGAGRHGAGVTATTIGVVSLLITATGVFGEIQTALNAIWRAEPRGSTAWQLLRTRLLSLGLVAILSLVLIVSLALSAVVSALQTRLKHMMPVPPAMIYALNFSLSLILLTLLVAAVYKVLPDRQLYWRDVAAGAVVTALLITVGKVAIAVYIGSSATISGYGAAGSVVAALFFIYYAAQIFLLGAEFTRVYAEREEAIRRAPAASTLSNRRDLAKP